MDTTNIPTLTKLVCGRPHSPTRAEFPAVEAKKNESCDFFAVDPADIVKNGMIAKQSGNDVLDYEAFDGPFDKWLVEHANPPWCEDCKVLKEKRPKEKLRKVLRAVIKAVGLRHKEGRAHGGLRHKGNYYIRIKGDKVDVELLNEVGEVDGAGTNLERMKRDVADLLEMIFDDVLKIEVVVGEDSKVEEWEKRISDDLLHLKSIMRTCASVGGRLETFIFCWNLMLDHTSLWHFRSRLQLYGKAWDAFNDLPHTVRDNIVVLMPDQWVASKRWKSKISGNDFFQKILKAPRVATYPRNGVGLLRYLRTVGLHAKKDKSATEKAYFDKQTNPEYLKEEYVEKLVRDTFPESAIAVQALMWEAGTYLDDFES